MVTGLNVDWVTVAIFLILFIVFTYLGFYGSKWRRGDLSRLDEWGLAGRRLGAALVWFLVGADVYTAYTFIAVPEIFFEKGPLFFYAVPYVSWAFGVAMLTMPRLWTVAKKRGYVTAADFVRDRFNSKALAIAVALTGVVAELPYIALQIVGMQAVLGVLLLGLGVSSKIVSDLALTLAFIVLAAFTFTSGLRGATLDGVFKDVLIWTTVIVTITVALVNYGDFAKALTIAHTVMPKINYYFLSPKLYLAYWSYALGSTLALYLYPHAINGSLASQDREKLKIGTAFLPLYGIGLALLALFGLLVFNVPTALHIVIQTVNGKTEINGQYVVPALVAAITPDWFVGLAFLAIFIGGLVPAAIMSIGVANLFVRNVVEEFVKLTPQSEATWAKITAAIFKFLALAFVFLVPATYAIQLQLLGGIIITQTLPAVFLGLFTDKLEKNSTLAGWAAGIISGVGLTVYVNFYVNHSTALTTSLFTTPLGPIYIALVALAINLVVAGIGSGIAYLIGWRPYGIITEKDFEEEVKPPTIGKQEK